MDKISFHNFRSKTPINNINKKITNHQNVNNVISVYVKVNNDKYKKNKLPIIQNHSKEKINYLKTEESKKILRLNKSNHKFKIKNFNELKEKLNFNLNSNSNSHSNKTIVINNIPNRIKKLNKISIKSKNKVEIKKKNNNNNNNNIKITILYELEKKILIIQKIYRGFSYRKKIL